MIFNKGDRVLCVKENDIPRFIGTVWTVINVNEDNGLVYCQNKKQFKNKYEDNDLFPFRKTEIVLVTPLIEELLWVI